MNSFLLSLLFSLSVPFFFCFSCSPLTSLPFFTLFLFYLPSLPVSLARFSFCALPCSPWRRNLYRILSWAAYRIHLIRTYADIVFYVCLRNTIYCSYSNLFTYYSTYHVTLTTYVLYTRYRISFYMFSP